jgi:hypothetical protein
MISYHRGHRDTKMPNSKSQNPNKFQYPIFETSYRQDSEFWKLAFGYYLEFGAWDLGVSNKAR